MYHILDVCVLVIISVYLKNISWKYLLVDILKSSYFENGRNISCSISTCRGPLSVKLEFVGPQLYWIIDANIVQVGIIYESASVAFSEFVPTYFYQLLNVKLQFYHPNPVLCFFFMLKILSLKNSFV